MSLCSVSCLPTSPSLTPAVPPLRCSLCCPLLPSPLQERIAELERMRAATPPLQRSQQPQQQQQREVSSRGTELGGQLAPYSCQVSPTSASPAIPLCQFNPSSLPPPMQPRARSLPSCHSLPSRHPRPRSWRARCRRAQRTRCAGEGWGVAGLQPRLLACGSLRAAVCTVCCCWRVALPCANLANNSSAACLLPSHIPRPRRRRAQRGSWCSGTASSRWRRTRRRCPRVLTR